MKEVDTTTTTNEEPKVLTAGAGLTAADVATTDTDPAPTDPAPPDIVVEK